MEAQSGMSWGVRQSFTEYVERSGGVISATPPARIDDGPMCSWIARSAHEAQALEELTGSLEFEGTIHFFAHFGAMDFELTNPEIRVVEGEGQLSVQTRPGVRMNIADISVVDVPAVEGFRAWAAASVRLTLDGTVLFGGVYPEGEAMDPAIFVMRELEDG